MVSEELNTSKDRKGVLYREIEVVAAALGKGYTKEADPQIFRYAAGLLEYEQAGALLCFVGTSSEIDTAPIPEDALRRGKRVGVSRYISRGTMEVREIRNLRDLRVGKYGIMEPGAHAPIMQAEEINLATVPCMSYSHGGRRPRYGDGYYDHYLGRTRAVRAVICRERIMRADVSMEPHDQMMDMVIPKKGVRWLAGQ